MATAGWRFAIDRGGTFTDVLGVAPDGVVTRLKLLSEAPGQYADAVTEGICRVLHWPAAASLCDAPIDSVRLGTTVATNALLEGRGARTGLLLSEGLADLLLIDDQTRPQLFRLDNRREAPLYEVVAEVPGRLAAGGTLLRPHDRARVGAILAQWRAQGIESVAISLLHGWQAPDEELALARLAEAHGYACVVCGHQSSGSTNYLERSQTALVDACLGPVLARYLDRLERALGPGRLLLMRSDGALVPPQRLSGAAAVLSGPAGGVAACVALARRSDSERPRTLVGFDMGGTSTDVCVVSDGQAARGLRRLRGLRLGLPMLEVHTVAAGGGSIIDCRDGQLVVGPASAGADPGPACYGRGGPATISDANLVLGRLLPEALPRVFGANGDGLLDRAAAERALAEVGRRLRPQQPLSAIEVASGALALADESMAQAVHALTTARGLDPAEAVLNGFGGAGGQHVCAVAERLGIGEVWLHPLGGVLSAWGIGISAESAHAELPLEQPLSTQALQAAGGARAQWWQQQSPPATARLQPSRLRLRLQGGGELDFLLGWDGGSDAASLMALERDFCSAFARHFGHAPPQADRVLAAVEVSWLAPADEWPAAADASDDAAAAPQAATVGCPVLSEHAVPSSHWLPGPALVLQPLSTLYVAGGWRLRREADGLLRLRRAQNESSEQHGALTAPPAEPAQGADPVRLALYHHRFMHLAEQMGEVLRRSARSVNIRERLDYSCALFDATGQLIANAPHMPVHLGSMGESVRAVLAAAGGRLHAGEAWLLNDPYRGGTHLPDITVVSPCVDSHGRLRAILASRAHHADVGGISPGSMPAASRSVQEEGVLLPPTRIMLRHQLDRSALLALFSGGPWPSRDPLLNVGEIEAQLAANQRGIELFQGLLERHGEAEVDAYLAHVLDHTEALLRTRLRSLQGGRWQLHNDQGACLCVRIEVDADAGSLRVDFGGSAAQQPDNYNAPLAVVRAAVLYVLRCLIDHPVPLNEGFARPLDLIVPSPSMLAPGPPAAVVAGNVETSQLLTDLLLLALGAQAGSQGTMNNLSFGNAGWQYYETLCGGVGAGPGFSGASAMHSHMTNSRITDPEVLERRFPLRLECFAIRPGSGGAGRFRGGDGVIRRIRFLQPVELSMLAGRRASAPPGLAGGSDGSPGLTRVLRADGSIECLPYAAALSLKAGDAIEVQTPGGGGWGRLPD